MARRQNNTQTNPVTKPAEAEAVEAVVEAPVTETVPEAVEAPVVEKKVDAAVEASKVNNTSGFLRAELDKYAVEMASNRHIPGTVGANNQVKLYRLIDRVMNRVSKDDFAPCLNTLLNWFHENSNGVTSDRFLFRFSAEWSAGREQYDAFVRLATLCSLIADPKSRQNVIGTLNIPYYTAFGLSETGRERLLAFLGR